jgi:SAM-dependent methyltransferase
MSKRDRLLRRIVPSTALISRSPAFAPLLAVPDALARGMLRVFGKRTIPPLRYIVRTGVSNSIFFPHNYYLTASYSIWMYLFSRGLASLGSHVVDIGSGVGKSAVALRDFGYNGERFAGSYHGFDIDPEMVAWCRSNFPADRFRFTCLDMNSSVYNPGGTVGKKPGLDYEDGQADLVFSQSLFSHLLEDDIRHYLRESYRVLRPGGAMLMTFFCMEDLEERNLLGGRWTFRHPMGAARVEHPKYPESAVAYSREWMLDAARACGFSSASVILPAHQSTLECIK